MHRLLNRFHNFHRSAGNFAATRGERRALLRPVIRLILLLLALLSTLAFAASPTLFGREKEGIEYGAGLIVNVPLPEAEVIQVVQDVVQNSIIRGTKEYNKDEFVTGAAPADSTRVFKPWKEAGKVFYKVRLKVLDPRNFKDSNDLGTLAVRYIVQPQGDKNTVLRINAVFVEDFRHVAHASNGSVEAAEYKDIHDRLDAIEGMKSQTAEAEKEKQERLSGRPESSSSSSSQPGAAPTQTVAANSESPTPPPSTPAAQPQPAPSTPQSANNNSPPANVAAPSPGQVEPAQSLPEQTPLQSPEERLKDLRRQVERLVKAPGAPLKSAPFHTASTLQSLPAGTEVLIVISTPYWYGVETHDGQHGWMLRDQLELRP